jgi:hypothetical protein
MSVFDRGPISSFEITWMSGHTETVQAHQVSWPNAGASLFGDPAGPVFIRFHGEIEGRWTLVLQAREEEIRTVRNVTSGEVLA